MSINLDPGENLLLKESKNGKIPLRQMLALVIKLLIFDHCLEVMFFKENR